MQSWCGIKVWRKKNGEEENKKQKMKKWKSGLNALIRGILGAPISTVFFFLLLSTVPVQLAAGLPLWLNHAAWQSGAYGYIGRWGRRRKTPAKKNKCMAAAVRAGDLGTEKKHTPFRRFTGGWLRSLIPISPSSALCKRFTIPTVRASRTHKKNVVRAKADRTRRLTWRNIALGGDFRGQ